jgi:phospholipase/carboxylesterase
MSGWAAKSEKVGQLDCRVIEYGGRAKVAVILCHGYGAPGEDLVSLAEVFIDFLGDQAADFRFIFPAAPLQPPEIAVYGGRAWWEINMAALLAASQASAFSQLHDKTPPGIETATEMLVSTITQSLDDLGGSGRYVLGGFSQGAMLTMNTTLLSDVPPPELLVQFSGTLVCQPKWQTQLNAGRLRHTTVVQSHGRQDPILPFSSAQTLFGLIENACKSAKFLAFNGPHTIPMDALTEVAVRLKAIGS